MLRALVLTLLLAGYASASCKLTPSTTPNKADKNGQCSFYDGDGGSCCETGNSDFHEPPDVKTRADYTVTGQGTTECKAYSDNCRDILHLASCAHLCSPDQDKFISTSSGISVTYCRGFAQHIYDSCKDDEVVAETSGGYECVVLGQKWSTVDDYFADLGPIKYKIVDGIEDCLNSAPPSLVMATSAGTSLQLSLLVALATLVLY